MFNINIVQALYGDSLLVEYGTPVSCHYLLIDGGPPGVYRAYLRPTLQQIASSENQLDLVVLTHTDDDHVVGLVDMFDEILTQTTDHQPVIIGVQAVWMNSFESDCFHSTRWYETAPSFEEGGECEDDASVRSIRSTVDLRALVSGLGVSINAGFARNLVAIDTAPGPVRLDNLTLHIIGPTEANLERQRKEWRDWWAARARAVAAADNRALIKADQSVPNRSSIMFVAEADGLRALFTGDGRGDHVVQGLIRAGLMKKGGTFHVDLMKLPHHGSARNVSRKFFNQVTADVYVICANGQNGNPDLATMIWLVEAAKDQERKITLLLTDSTPAVQQLCQEYPPEEYGYCVQAMTSSDCVLQVCLASKKD